MNLMSKDLRLVGAMGKEYGEPLYITALVRQLYETAIYATLKNLPPYPGIIGKPPPYFLLLHSN